MNKKKKQLLIGIPVAVLCLALIVLGVISRLNTLDKGMEAGEAGQTAQGSQSTDGTADAPVGSEEDTADGEEAASRPDPSKAELIGDEPAAESGEEEDTPKEDAPADSSASGESGQKNEEQKPDQQEGAQPISFPYTIPGSSLVVQTIAGYDGPYLEDGADEDVSNIAAMIIRNSGSVDIEYAEVEVETKSGTLTFVLTDLPAGATLAAQESNRSAYSKQDCYGVRAEVAENNLEQSSKLVKVEEEESGSLLVTNLSGSDIPCVRVFYKYYLDEDSAYLGGITYTAKLTNLEAGDARSIQPTHYLQGYSKVVMVRTYDTAD